MSSNHLTSRLQSIIDRALAYNVASSIALSVCFGGENSSPPITLFGGVTTKCPPRKTSDKTIFDLASLTKILGTTVAVLYAQKQGLLSLDEKPFLSWPNVSIKHLLAHRSGLPAHVRFYEQLRLDSGNYADNQKQIFSSLFSLCPQRISDERIYSDLGFIALGWLLEQRCKKPLWDIFNDTWNDRAIFPQFTWFSSAGQSYQSEDVTLAPTGFCRVRNSSVVGQVHDPNCYYLGGLAGHAGLFGSLNAVKTMGQFFLRSYVNPSDEITSFIKPFADAGLGFDKPSPKGSTRYFSPQAFGHFGYTGTSLWIDPSFDSKNGIVITLLTNRVHCSDKPEGIFWLRTAINRAIFS